ncbi:MAG: hypothetical protein KGL39_51130 [Patescibacteria group bacterium]|nr:hypothetical protein [Patescibacteria group bacterium]
MNAMLPIPSRPRLSGFGQALFSLAMMQRRLAHQAKRDAIEAERAGRLDRYLESRKECNRLWHDAKWHLAHVRQEYDRRRA